MSKMEYMFPKFNYFRIFEVNYTSKFKLAGKFMLDTFEKLILKVLQRDGRASTQALSDAVGLSPSPCWRRVKRLEEDGYITRYAAILDGKKLGLYAFAHVQVSLVDHTESSINIFQAFVEKNEQVLECASITGDFDFILKVAASDPEALEQFIMRNLLRLGVVRTTSTIFILRQMKVSGVLPVDM
jgi:Lrp/AsnC family leucine-responsive transcriptional regulator